MKHTKKCSAILAASAGAAVCITGSGGSIQAAGVSGTIAGSNGGNSVFGTGMPLNACSSAASWFLFNAIAGRISFSSGTGSGGLNFSSNYAIAHSAGVLVSSAMAGGFSNRRRVPDNVSGKYFAVRYGDLGGGVRYGWLHVVSTNAGGTSMTLDQWGYENTGASIHTLAGSVTARKLGLADGREKLVWSNANEEGVARYEVQTKDAAGQWHAVSSEAPGAGMYSMAVPAGAECRVVVEKVDGTAEHIAF